MRSNIRRAYGNFENIIGTVFWSFHSYSVLFVNEGHNHRCSSVVLRFAERFKCGRASQIFSTLTLKSTGLPGAIARKFPETFSLQSGEKRKRHHENNSQVCYTFLPLGKSLFFW